MVLITSLLKQQICMLNYILPYFKKLPYLPTIPTNFLPYFKVTNSIQISFTTGCKWWLNYYYGIPIGGFCLTLFVFWRYLFKAPNPTHKKEYHPISHYTTSINIRLRTGWHFISHTTSHVVTYGYPYLLWISDFNL